MSRLVQMDDIQTKKQIAARIKSRREHLWRETGEFTQEFVAEKLGIAGATYSRWESGQISITGEGLVKLAGVLRCEVWDFYRDDQDAFSDEPSIQEWVEAGHSYTPEERAEGLRYMRFRKEQGDRHVTTGARARTEAEEAEERRAALGR